MLGLGNGFRGAPYNYAVTPIIVYFQPFHSDDVITGQSDRYIIFRMG